MMIDMGNDICDMFGMERTSVVVRDAKGEFRDASWEQISEVVEENKYGIIWIGVAVKETSLFAICGDNSTEYMDSKKKDTD